MTEYPEYYWKPWKFERAPNLWWQQVGARFFGGDPVTWVIVRAWFQELEDKLQVSQPSDWYYVKRSNITRHQRRILKLLGGNLLSILTRLYPEHQWDADKFTAPRRNLTQETLFERLTGSIIAVSSIKR